MYVITTRAPVEWTEPNNQLFIKMAKEHSNLGVIDWAALSGEHPDLLYDDGIHPNQLGVQEYVRLIFRAVCGS